MCHRSANGVSKIDLQKIPVMQKLPGSTTFLQIHKIPWPCNYSSKVAHRFPFSVALWEQALPAVRSVSSRKCQGH